MFEWALNTRLDSKENKIQVTRFAIWYHLYSLKIIKNANERVLLLVKLQALVCNFTKSNIPPWVFLKFSKLYKWTKSRKASHIFISLCNIPKNYFNSFQANLPYLCSLKSFPGSIKGDIWLDWFKFWIFILKNELENIKQ